MTQEEKAKAYDEALEKARKRVAIEPQDHTDAILKDIFPQLRESEDERVRKALIQYLKDYPCYLPNGLYSRDDFFVYLEKQKEQKPAEWSEEDEDMLNSCISSIEEAKENRYAYRETDGDTSYDHEISWLKSLRPQPHTVSVKDATKFGNLEYERGVKDGIQSEKSRHWKPSEEQMDALKELIDDANRAGWVTPGATELYEQLKKLM